MLEHLAESVAQFLFAFTSAIVGLELKIQKPSAIPLADFASVSIVRTRSDYPWIQPAGKQARAAKELEDVYLALGSNLGNRGLNLHLAIESLAKFCTVKSVSHLYDTNPKYVTDQPKFLNCVVKVTTSLEPPELLEALKGIESDMKREKTMRNGPRVIDLDILLYGSRRVLLSTLVIPHPQMQERDFVMGPLLDIAPPNFVHPTLAKSLEEIWLNLNKCPDIIPVWHCSSPGRDTEVVIPYHQSSPSQVMGILNVTPDSFSDGGQYSANDMPVIIEQIKKMYTSVKKMGRILVLDIGGESTRPGATPVSAEEEASRVIPVVEALRKEEWFVNADDVLISVDTWKSEVADKAIAAGAHVINDVTAGRDPKMFEVAAKHRVPLILMHSRGTPETMSELADYVPGKVVATVAEELKRNIQSALETGIYPWHILVDVGIGFAKNMEQNLEILRDLSTWKAAVGNYALVVGTSRKGFIGKLVQEQDPGRREFGTAATVTASIAGGAHLLRVHDVENMTDVITVTDAIFKGL
eukprot:TRINITY_DN6105_c0_g1_i2.p1 TRINITY_DN6105_c0_g1~~TRINITY_DN6105_c0_g1_i2.p1  ORF type:complete len:526 (-),score=118.67 TRINITY_DN6105_c0_g1_i2:352-1929(-)